MANDRYSESLPISEFRDDAELRSNLFATPLHGREPIIEVLAIVDDLCRERMVVKSMSRGARDYITTKASLDKLHPIGMEAICLRDEEGWIYAASLHVEPEFAAALLVNRLAETLTARDPARR